jgi:NAD+ kinase
MKLVIYGQRLKEDNVELVKYFFAQLAERKMELGIYVEYVDKLEGIIDLNKLGYQVINNHEELVVYAPKMIITLGGDGTILNAVTLVRGSQIPILGINLGRLGFLANVEKDQISQALDDVMNGRYKSESRTLLKLDCEIPLFGEVPFALNDFTIHKRDTSSMITIHTYVDGDYLNSYWADGIIVSTPTGSTGYSMSCGGPIVFPGSGNLVITPVAPHNLNVRPLVISDSSVISFEIEGRGENFLCTLDSRYEAISQEHRLFIRKCDFEVQLAIIEGIDFMETIRKKLMWGIDKRN